MGYTWHDVIKECEQVLGCEDSAVSPLMCNLPNLIRDLQWRLKSATQPAVEAEREETAPA